MSFKGFDAWQYNLGLTSSSLIGTAGGKRRISSNFLLLLISPNRTTTAQSLLMAESLIIISTHGYIAGTQEVRSKEGVQCTVQCIQKGKSDANGRALP